MKPTLSTARRSPLTWSRPATTGRADVLRDVQLLETTLAAIDTAVCVHEDDGAPLVVNPAALALLGADTEALAAADPAALPHLEHVLTVAREHRPLRDVLLRHRRPADGELVTLSAHLERRLVGGSFPIVVSRLAAADGDPDMRRVAARLRLQVENLREGVVLLDAALAIRSMNGAARRLIGHDEQALWDIAVQRRPGGGRSPFRALVRAALRATTPVRDVAARIGSGPGARRLSLDVTPVDGHAVLALRDVTREHRRQEELVEAAYRDELTGLGNRRLFDEGLERALRRARRYQRALAVCMLDVDGLKQVNDRLGHAAGDRVLRRVGDVLRAQLRDSDLSARGTEAMLSARYGGDEFLVLFDEVGGDPHLAALAAMRRVLSALETEPMPTPMPVSVSAGVAAHPGDGDDAAALLAAADARMYEHKRRRG